MNLSKDLPPFASWNFSPVPSAETHSRLARVSNNKGEWDFMASFGVQVMVVEG